jgi:DNA polymerase-1
MLIKLLKEERPGHILIVFDSGKPTFRDDIYAEYKAQREEAPDTLIPQFAYIKRAVDGFGLVQVAVDGFEADDVIGTLVEQQSGDQDICIVTGDKDMMQLVGPRVTLLDTMNNRRTGVREVKEKLGVMPEQVVDMMALMGDPIDNIPGVKGIGGKTATLLIQEFSTLDNLLASLDRLNGTKLRGAERVRDLLRDQKDQALMSRELARIRRDVPVSLTLEEMKPRPPKHKDLQELFRELEFHQLLKQWAPADESHETGITVVRGVHASPALVDRLRGGDLALSPLMSGEGNGRGGLLGLGLSRDGKEGFFVANEGRAIAGLKPLLDDPGGLKIGHDLKQLVVGLEREGIELRGPLFDVMVASYLINPAKGHDLPMIALEFLNESMRGGGGQEEATAEKACLLLRLKAPLEEKLVQQKALDLFHGVEMPLVRVLAAMEKTGVKIDSAALAQASGDWQLEMDRLMGEIYSLAGTTFNIGSPPQLRQVLFERLGISTKGVRKGKTGFSTDNDVLTKLALSHPLPHKILEYRGLAKLKSTYGDALPPLVHAATGRIHTSFNQTVAATGRLSSSDPNLQNIPIRTREGRRIREAFVAEEGFALLSADYSQMELRIMAHLSQDKLLKEAFFKNEDIHCRTASEVFRVKPGEVNAEQRRRAKTINFGIIYGMGAQRLAQELGIPREEAEELLGRYFERYSGVKAYMVRSIEEARRLGYVSTLLNRRRLLPEIHSKEGGMRQAAERIAINTPVQGSAADIIKVAMVRIHVRMEQDGCRSRMILQVHDELVFEVSDEEREQMAQMVRVEMERVVDLRVPLRVELSFGSNWAEAH